MDLNQLSKWNVVQHQQLHHLNHIIFYIPESQSVAYSQVQISNISVNELSSTELVRNSNFNEGSVNEWTLDNGNANGMGSHITNGIATVYPGPPPDATWGDNSSISGYQNNWSLVQQNVFGNTDAITYEVKFRARQISGDGKLQIGNAYWRIFEDYITNDKIKNVANRLLYGSAVVIPLITIILISNL